MNNPRYLIYLSALFMIVTALVYSIYFFYVLDYEISKEVDDWAHLGSYFGGVVGPALSFISLIMLIKTLELQNAANSDLRTEAKSNENSRKIESFETTFFHLISIQREHFENLRIKQKKTSSTGTASVVTLEESIEAIRDKGGDDKAVKKYLEDSDENEDVYNSIRVFYNLVNLVMNKISDKNGFSPKDRYEYLLILVNFTKFSNLRLVLIGIQFLSYPSATSLRENKELTELFSGVGLNIDKY